MSYVSRALSGNMPKALGDIVRLQLDCIGTRIRENYTVTFVYDDAVVENIASLCNDPESTSSPTRFCRRFRVSS
jgi:C-terminal, D2-small domain, of ClpB protein